MRPDRLDRWAGLTLGLLALTLAGLLLAQSARGLPLPVVDPPDGGVGSARAGPRLTFEAPMVQASVESRLALEPDHPLAPPPSIGFAWQGNELRLTLGEALQPGSSYTLRLAPGAQAISGTELKTPFESSFTVRPPLLLYLTPSGDDSQLWAWQDGKPRRLSAMHNVREFEASPDGRQIVISHANEQGGFDLSLVHPQDGQTATLVHCGRDICSMPAWSPDGLRIAYARESRETPEARPSPPRVWTVSSQGGETLPLFADSQVLGYDPSWSPDGRRLAFFDAAAGGIHLLDLETGAEAVLPTVMGEVGSWSPDGREMLFTTMSVGESEPVVEIYRADLEAQETRRVEITEEAIFDLGRPLWSPVEDRFAMRLRPADGGAGRQLWLLSLDGQPEQLIAGDTAFAYGGMTWDPTGQQLAFQQISRTDPEAGPQIVVWSAAGGGLEVVANDARSAGWLP